MTANNFAGRLEQVKLGTKSNIAGFVKETNFDNKLESLLKKSYFK